MALKVMFTDAGTAWDNVSPDNQRVRSSSP